MHTYRARWGEAAQVRVASEEQRKRQREHARSLMSNEALGVIAKHSRQDERLARGCMRTLEPLDAAIPSCSSASPPFIVLFVSFYSYFFWGLSIVNTQKVTVFAVCVYVRGR